MPLDKFYCIGIEDIRDVYAPNADDYDYDALNAPAYYAFYEAADQVMYADTVDQSNTAVFRERYPEIVSIYARLPGHWSPSWYLAIPVTADLDTITAVRDDWAGLQAYPLLDDEDYSNRISEIMDDIWEDMPMRERIELCREHGASVFAARREIDELHEHTTLYEHIHMLATEL